MIWASWDYDSTETLWLGLNTEKDNKNKKKKGKIKKISFYYKQRGFSVLIQIEEF